VWGVASTKSKKARSQARERLAAERAARARRERRAKFLIFGTTGVVVVVLVALVVWALSSRRSDDGSDLPRPMASVGTAKPPWPAPADPLPGAKAAGLAVSNMEGTANHFHTHLDVIVDGKPVPVPANIGVTQGSMVELHTHDASGVLHVESPKPKERYILGQLFREWQVRLDPNAIGGLKADGTNTLRAYVNGKRVSGDPAAIELKNHEEIALVYGPADAKVDIPSSYDFPAGS
jgi:hypothetical protein